MTFPQRILVVLVCLLTTGADIEKSTVDGAKLAGAWLQTDLKWEATPSDANRRQRTSQAVILYFSNDHEFALMHCVVNQAPGEDTVISHEDRIGLYRGQWALGRKGISVWFQFVPVVPRHWPEAPQTGLPIQHAIISQSHLQLTFST